jgi:hypothetical protein
LRAALRLAGAEIRKLNFGKKDTPLLRLLRRVLREARAATAAAAITNIASRPAARWKPLRRPWHEFARTGKLDKPNPLKLADVISVYVEGASNGLAFRAGNPQHQVYRYTVARVREWTKSTPGAHF